MPSSVRPPYRLVLQLAIPTVGRLVVDPYPEVLVVANVAVSAEAPATNSAIVEFRHAPAAAKAVLANLVTYFGSVEDITLDREGCRDVTASPPIVELRAHSGRPFVSPW